MTSPILKNTPRFDMLKAPVRQRLRWLIRLLSIPTLVSHKAKIHKINMEGIKPPYILYGNHNAFMDFMVMSKAVWPHRVNFVVAIDGYIGREWLLRSIGGICKRKFTNDIALIKHLKTVIKNGDIALIYPEARYSLCGTTAIFENSLAKLAKFLDVPVVTLITHGHHINSPFFNLPDHKVKGVSTDMTCIATKEEVEKLPVEELQKRIEDAFVYDDYKWQKDNNIRVTYKGRANGLHKVLYQCPHCGVEYEMDSKGTELFCNACGKRWEMSELGELKALEGETEFSHIPDWYEWERANVRKEVDAGTYHFETPVHIDALPNAKKFIHMGPGKLIHDMNGFHLEGTDEGTPFSMDWPAGETYSVHIEYEYLGKFGDCVDLNTLEDTLYVYPEAPKFSVTKMSLATEELFKRIQETK